jgi:hypothetical protein
MAVSEDKGGGWEQNSTWSLAWMSDERLTVRVAEGDRNSSPTDHSELKGLRVSNSVGPLAPVPGDVSSAGAWPTMLKEMPRVGLPVVALWEEGDTRTRPTNH